MKSPAEHASFLGRGWAFPPAFDPFSHGPEMAESEEDIRQAMRLIFAITPGDRQMLPPFGCNLRQFVFSSRDASVLTMIETEVRSALLHHEPRIDVNGVRVVYGASNASAIVITVDYTVRSSNRRYNLVYPYYLNEATGIPG